MLSFKAYSNQICFTNWEKTYNQLTIFEIWRLFKRPCDLCCGKAFKPTCWHFMAYCSVNWPRKLQKLLFPLKN